MTIQGDPENVALGVCQVIVDGVDVGFTIGGAEGIYGPEYHTVKVDQHTGPIDQRLIGEMWGAKCNMAERTLSNLKLAMTHATQSAGKLTIGSYAGKSSRDKAHTVVLHPIDMADDHSMDWIIYKAVATAELTLAFKNDGESVIPVTFDGLVDTTKTDGNFLGMIGDSAA